METNIENPQYQLLVHSIQETFKGSDKVSEVLYSLNALFSHFDDHMEHGNESRGSLSHEKKYERDMLLGVITILLDHLIKDQNNSIKTETVTNFLKVFKSGMDQSTVALNMLKEFNNAKSLLQKIKDMFESDGVSDNDIEEVTQRIDSFLYSSYNANNSLALFQDRPWDDNENFDDNQELMEKLSTGWSKNEHELQKRSKKLEYFRNESAEKLQILEQSIDESKKKNEKFRKTLDETSDKISFLIEELHDTTKQSEFLRKQIDIVDSTVSEMEKNKQKTDEEYAQLEGELFEKQNSLIQFLKSIDCSLDESLTRHQEILEKNDSFNEALEELAKCYSDFEKEENAILEKHSLTKFEHSININDTNNKDFTELKEQIYFLQQEREDVLNELEKIEGRNSNLVSDVEDLFQLNNQLTNENLYLHSQLEDLSLNQKDEKEKEENLNTYENKTNNKEVEELKVENEELRQKNEKLKEESINKIMEDTTNNEDKEKLRVENEELRQKNEKLKEESIKIMEDKTNNEDKEKLRVENEELRQKNERLSTINVKIQEIYNENKELVEENNQLQEDVEKLEEEIKNHENFDKIKDAKQSQLAEEIAFLKHDIERVNTTRQARILRIKTNMADIVTLQDNSKDIKEEEEDTNEFPALLENILQNERDRNVTLEKSNKQYQSLNSTLTNLCRKIGLDKLELETSYTLKLQSESGIGHVYTLAGLTLSLKEIESVKSRCSLSENNRSDVCYKAEENVVDELSAMLQDSYVLCDRMKHAQKQLHEQVENLNAELKHQQNNANMADNPSISHGVDSLDVNGSSMLQSFVKLFQDMGLSQLQYGVMYSVHYQAISKIGTGRRPSTAFQHSVNAVNFDAIKDQMNKLTEKNVVAASPKPTRKISHVPSYMITTPLSLNTNTLQKDYTNEEESVLELVKVKGRKSTDQNVQELERLLRIAKRENEEILKKNRSLRQELNHLKENKERFNDIQRKKNKTQDEEEENKVVPQTQNTHQMVDAEDMTDLEQAYQLSEANCAFLEKQNKQLTNRLNHAESLIDQSQNNMFDKDEQIECINQSMAETRKQSDQDKKEIKELKKDIDYLETDLEYCKVKLQEAGIEHLLITERHVYSRITDTEMSMRADFEVMITEKNSLILECESLTAKIKFLDAEKKFATEEARIMKSAQNKSEEEEEEKEIQHHVNVIDTREKSNSFVEKEVKTQGLAKRFKALQREFEKNRNELQNAITENLKADQTVNLMLIEVEALRSSNKELEDKIIDLEQFMTEQQHKKDNTNSNKITDHKNVILDMGRRLSVIDEHNKNSSEVVSDLIYKECEVIKEEAIYLAQENNEIKESNGFLLRRNSNLRRESLAAGTTKKQLELLKEKLNTMENENAILKLESMTPRGRRKSMSRKISQQCYDIMDVKTFKLNIDTNSKQTQTEKIQMTSPQISMSDNEAMDVEEMEFVIEDLTKRNTELKAKHYNLEQKIIVLERENQHLDEVNEKVLKRNSNLKQQVEVEKNTKEEALNKLSESDIDISDEQGLGINLFFKNDILGEYEKAELEEQNKSYQYENQMLKQDIIAYQKTFKKKDGEEEKLQEKLIEMEKQLYEILQNEKNKEIIQSTITNNGDIPMINISFMADAPAPTPPPSAFSTIENAEMNEMRKLKKDNVHLVEQNDEYRLTIEHLERQILYGNQQQQQPTMNASLLNKDAKQDTTQEEEQSQQNGTIDELFEVKFLLESNVEYLEETHDGDDDDVRSIGSNKSNQSDDENIFQGCIHEGELTSEMEDFFRKYTEGGGSSYSLLDLDSINEEYEFEVRKEEVMMSQTVTPVFAEPPVAHKVKELQRFRAKEDLEKAVLQQEKDLHEYKKKNKEIEERYKQSEQQVQKLRAELQNLDKKLQLSKTSYMECSTTLNDRTDEVAHHLQRIKDLERIEESLCIEINHLDSQIKEKSEQVECALSEVEECKHKQEASKKECNDYKVMLEEQERLQQETHEKTSTMQRDFNDLYKDLTEKDEFMKEISDQLKTTSEELEEKRRELEIYVKEREGLLDEVEIIRRSVEDLSSKNASLENVVHDYETNFLQLEDGLNAKLQSDDAVKQRCEALEEGRVEQDRLIESLRDQLRDSEDVIALYEETNAQKDVFDLNALMPTDEFSELNNISFEIKQASFDCKRATEISMDNGDVTLPEIQISRLSRDLSREPPCSKCLQRSYSSTRSTHNNSLFPNKYFEATNGGLSEVSDIESCNGDSDEGTTDGYPPDYVKKLKLKLKKSRDKVRDRNKVIQNQNEDIDNFLEDIRSRENRIEELTNEIIELHKQKKKQEEENGIIGFNTPEFLDSSTVYPSNDNIVERDIVISELIALAEECCLEIKVLQNTVEEFKIFSHDQGLSNTGEAHNDLKQKLKVSEDKIHKLRLKLSKYIDLGLVSASQSYEDRFYDTSERSTPSVLDIPGKTVNEIRNENEKLKIYNEELIDEIQGLKQQLIKDNPQFNSSLAHDQDTLAHHQDSLSHDQDSLINDQTLKTNDLLSLNHKHIRKPEDVEKEEKKAMYKQKNYGSDSSREGSDENGSLGDIITLSRTTTLMESGGEAKTDISSNKIEEDSIGGDASSNIKCGSCDDFLKYEGQQNYNRKEKQPDLEKKLNSLSVELTIAEAQIEKDWEIIEGQSSQLENLHQQFIQQRDENRQNSIDLEETNKTLINREQQIIKLNKEIAEIKSTSKGKEEELGRILVEKEDGIEKLHSMINELEKSLGNSQVHIEGILKVSMESRETEKSKDRLINEQDSIIFNLREELNLLTGQNTPTQTLSRTPSPPSQIPSPPSCKLNNTKETKGIVKNLKNMQEKTSDIKISQAKLRDDVHKLQEEYKKEMTEILKQISTFLAQNNDISFFATDDKNGIIFPDIHSPIDVLSVSSDNEALFIPKHKTFNNKHYGECSSSEGGTTEDFNWKSNYQQIEKENNKLNRQLDKHDEVIRRNETVHKIEINTIIQSLAKRSALIPKKNRSLLSPTSNLSKASSRMGQTEFLQKCLSQVKYSGGRNDNKETQSAPEV